LSLMLRFSVNCIVEYLHVQTDDGISSDFKRVLQDCSSFSKRASVSCNRPNLHTIV